MNDMMMIGDVMKMLNTTRPTINRHMKVLGIVPHTDPVDHRVRLLDREQIAELSRTIRRVQARTRGRGA